MNQATETVEDNDNVQFLMDVMEDVTAGQLKMDKTIMHLLNRIVVLETRFAYACDAIDDLQSRLNAITVRAVVH